MLHDLDYEVVFATGRSLKASVRFERGLTAVTGPNEAGKSLILEMIRYALFGAKALRGTAADYRKLAVRLDFAVRGTRYRVVRRTAAAELVQGTGKLAAGHTPVTQRIAQILGYTLTVFDVANACNQGEVEALGALKPAQRKAMVDQTIGLTQLDALAAWVAEQAQGELRAAQALEKVLVEPVAPAVPAGYRPAAELAPERDRLTAAVARLHNARGWLAAHAGRTAPVAPACPVAEPAAELERHQTGRGVLVERQRQLQARLAVLRPARVTAAEVDAFEAHLQAYGLWCTRVELEKRRVRPAHGREQLAAWAAAWPVLDAWRAYDAVTAEIGRLTAAGHHECPNCRHRWPIRQALIAEAQARHVAPAAERPARPPLTPGEIQAQLLAWDRYDAQTHELAAYAQVREVPAPTYWERDIAGFRRALEDQVQRDALEPELRAVEAALAARPDRAADLEARRRYDWQRAEYERQRTAWDAYLAEKAAVEREAAALAGSEARLAAVTAAPAAALAYEQALAAYQEQRAAYERSAAALETHRAQADQYERARTALKRLKGKVKQHLVPSLSAVASHLLAQMTGGARSRVEIDEDFDIRVDGQGLHTLSGSGKAAANLAIRLGLGQVLTNKVFSVFLGDEIDAAMDASRAGTTADCLQRLTDSLQQVVLVSHKRPDADHYIEVGG